jgi:hypothetical protein
MFASPPSLARERSRRSLATTTVRLLEPSVFLAARKLVFLPLFVSLSCVLRLGAVRGSNRTPRLNFVSAPPLAAGHAAARRSRASPSVDGVFWCTKHVHYTLVWI